VSDRGDAPTPLTQGIGSWIPQIFYDLIGRVVPGTVSVAVMYMAAVGPATFLKGLGRWASSEGSSITLIVLGGAVAAYTVGIVLGGLWNLGDLRARAGFLQHGGNYDDDFSRRYDYVKWKDPPAGARLAKLGAEMLMTRILQVGCALSIMVGAGFEFGERGRDTGRWIMLGVLVVSVVSLEAFRRHVSCLQKRALNHFSDFQGYVANGKSSASKTRTRSARSTKARKTKRRK